MKKQKTAKRAFISSLISLALCVTMLVGTTFAWYTDSVTSGRNTIVSGSLDMVLERYNGTDGDFSNAANWETVTADTKIFKEVDNKLTFEPGAVQVAYVRVKNAGDLAFKYSLAAKVYEEKAGTNQAGDSFLLSDYLKFGTATVTAPFATREAAIGAVSANATKLQDATLSANGAYLAKGADPVIVALVVYMPSDVGNDANPQPGDAYKPTISFGLNALATQYTIENDSFSNTYDDAATMPAMESSVHAAASGATTITTGPVTVTVPAGSTNLDTTDTLTLKVENFADNATTGAVTMDITLVDQDGDEVTNTANPMTVKVNVGTGKAITSVKHNGAEVTGYTYDEATGILTFTTSSFSPFAITYKVGKGVSNITELNDALADANVDTIVLLNNFTTGTADENIIEVTRNVIIDGNGYTITSNARRALWIDTDNVSLTLKNLTIDGDGKCERGVQVNNGLENDFYDAKIIIDNCTIKNVTHYAINLCSHTTVDLTITKSTISGWAAINAYGTGNVITVKDSELIGINNKSYNAEGWNNFATICLEGDTTGQTTMHSADYTISIENTTIRASQTTGNKQSLLGFNSHAENSSVAFKNCTFDIGNGCNFGYNYGTGNSMSIDGDSINMPSGHFDIATGGGEDPGNTPGTGPAFP